MVTKHSQSASLARAGYLASDAAVASLARDYMASRNSADIVRSSYLRVLVAHAQHELGNARVSERTQLDVLERVNARLYAVILRAVTTPDVANAEDLEPAERRRRALERNSRSAFARTAKSTLASWIKAGGKLPSLDPAEVSKGALRELYAQQRAGPSTLADRISRAESRLESLLLKVAKEDLDAARDMVEALRERLETVLETEPDAEEQAAVEEQPAPLTRTRKKIGELTFYPH